MKMMYPHSALLVQDKYFFGPKIDSDFSSFDQVMMMVMTTVDFVGGGLLMMKIGCIEMAVVPNLDIPSLQPAPLLVAVAAPALVVVEGNTPKMNICVHYNFDTSSDSSSHYYYY